MVLRKVLLGLQKTCRKNAKTIPKTHPFYIKKMMNFLFGGEKAPPPVDKETALKEKVKGWQKELRKSMTRLEHDRAKNERDMATMKANAAKLIAAGRAENAKMDIKNMLRLQQHNERLGETRATLNSLSMQLGEQRGAWAAAACGLWVLPFQVLLLLLHFPLFC